MPVMRRRRVFPAANRWSAAAMRVHSEEDKMKALAVGLVAVVVVAGANPAAAKKVGNWVLGSGQGVLEYSLRHGAGNTLTIACDEGFSPDAQLTGVRFEVGGKSPEPGSNVRVFVDGDPIDFSIGDLGSADTSCHVCADKFYYLWESLLDARSVIVELADGTSTAFDPQGARKMLGEKACRTNFGS